MTVYIAFRRGNWLYRFASALWWFGGRGALQRLCRWLQADSWMECSLYFSVQCVKDPYCLLCSKSRGFRPGDGSNYHYLSVSADAQNGVRALVDAPFAKPEAWVLLRMPLVTDGEARSFFDCIGPKRCGYNEAGAVVNFFPLPCAPSVGVGADNRWQDSQAFFCSELLTAFLQSLSSPSGSKLREALALTPRMTTPQLLMARLLECFPDLREQHYIIDPHASNKQLQHVPWAELTR
jgi:hypothetical protein